MLLLQTKKTFTHKDPHLTGIENGKLIPAREIEDLKDFFSREEADAILRE
jgi:S-adenosylmethionine:diacylglycerol 3-amino-3-carboxypropyl transferase